MSNEGMPENRKILTALKTLLFTILVPGTVTILLPALLLSSPWNRVSLADGPFRYPGLVLIILGALVYLRCAWEFAFAGKGTPAPIDPPKELVAKGLYRYSRNPMYVGVLSVVFGEALWFESLLLAGYGVILFSGFHLFIVFYEEPALRRKFGESYRRYCAATPRWFFRTKRTSRG